MKCPTCHTELELAPSRLYARCPSCQSLYMNVAGTWQHYPVDEASRESIERSLGFSNAADTPTEWRSPQE